MRSVPVATAVLQYGEKVLLVRRSESMMEMAGMWSAISGTIEGDEDPLDRAKIEILEETGIRNDEITFLRAGRPIRLTAEGYMEREWHIRPFLFECNTQKVRLNVENSEYVWVQLGQVCSYRTVPGLDLVISGLL